MGRCRASFVAASIPILVLLTASSAAHARRCVIPSGGWVAVSPRGAPSVSTETPVVEAGGRILVFGHPGAIFDPCANRWLPMAKGSSSFAIGAGRSHPVLVAGDRVVFLAMGGGGEMPFAQDGVTAAVYDAAANRWSFVRDQPEALPWRRGALAVAAGREIIVWGGVAEEHPGRGGRARLLDDGARLDPATGQWQPMSRKNAPSARSYARGVSTGTRLVVWGGMGTQTNPYRCGPPGECRPTAGGAVYDPATDTWAPMSAAGAPVARFGPAVKKVGGSVLIWGGVDHPDGALYDPGVNAWRALPPPPGTITQARLDDFDALIDDGTIVVITNRKQAAIFDLARWTWSIVPDPVLPLGLVDLRDLGGRAVRLIVQHARPGALGVGSLARVNARTARWELAPLPPRGSPSSLESGIAAWVEDRLVLWGPRHQEIRYENDPSGPRGCGPRVPGQPVCDPVIPVREVRIGPGGQEGGMLRPLFVTAPTR